jgi:hypothetical protein
MDDEMIPRKIFLLIFLILIVFLAGCDVLEQAFAPLPTLPPTLALPTEIVGTPTPWPTLLDSPTPTISPTPHPTRTKLPTMTASATLPPIIRVLPNSFPDYANPLTGYPVADPTLMERKPVIVKISNYPHGVRPQWGLSLADQAFEYYLEDGLTRFAGVFYGNDATQVGPIRSGRIFDATLLKMYNGIVVFNGADQKVVNFFNENDLYNSLVVERKGVTPLWRDLSLPEPHNLFGNTAEISAHVTERGSNNERPDLVTNAFYSIGNYGKDWAMQVHINYSYANYAYWEYDTDSGRYLRYQGSADNLSNDPQYELLTDSLTGFPIAADNVVVLFVPHEFFYKSSDTEIFDIKLIDKGDAYVFRDGKANPAVWVRIAEDKPLAIQDTGGGYFPLKPGITFFQIIHTDSNMNQNGSIWSFDFVRPTPPPQE